MPLPNSYVQSYNRIPEYFEAILAAQPPQKFTYQFLQDIGFTSSADRSIIGMLKELGFLDVDGVPQERYYRYLDSSQSEKVLAEAIREAYSDLFLVNKDAHLLTSEEVENKLRTLYHGQKSDRIIGLIAKAFEALSSIADFSAPVSKAIPVDTSISDSLPSQETDVATGFKSKAAPAAESQLQLRSLQYHINIVLPESRDQAVYDAIFKSLREHLGK
ncbi:MAG: DUF5343 domain-containing protein [Anaerolineae bacterium]|nr:DUF5343 domain-containing protein [Anaerolineae bacterium]